MFNLDQNTLVIVAAGVTILVSILLLYLESISKQIKGPKCWSLGSVLIGIGILSFAFYNYLGSFLAFVIGGSIIVLGIGLYHSGLRGFSYKPTNYWILFGLPVFNLIQGSIFTLMENANELRMIIYSIINIGLSVFMIIELKSLDKNSYRKVTNLGVIVFIVYGLSMTIRMFSVYQLKLSTAADEILITKIIFYSTILSLILMAFMFVTLFNIKLSNELKDQIKNRDRFFSIISHDLNGPVSTISEMLKALNRTELFDKEKRELLLNELEKLSSSTSLLLQNLLEWSSNQVNSIKVSKKLFDISQVINQNVLLLEQKAKAKSININYQNTETLYCFADPMMVDTILRNIISNSIKFTPKNGKVSIDAIKNHDFVTIAVKDNGIGISKEVLMKLEKKQILVSTYGTDGEKGAGLGLSLCKDFLEKNSGKIEVISSKNYGSEIKISLPVDLDI